MIKNFTVEYRKNPIGIDVNPRFSWKIVSNQLNVVQMGYQIIVKNEFDVIWDSKEVKSDKSVLVKYEGQPLQAMTKYEVSLTVWTNKGEVQKSECYFETGLLVKENWQANWISHNIPSDEACPVFIKKIELLEKKIKKARIYATCCGVYEIYMNNERVGDTFLAPGWTSYHKRLQYQTYDITSVLEQTNNIEITLGNGWYSGYLNGEGENHFYGDKTALLAMVRVEYEDGQVEVFGTDTDWEVSESYIKSSEFYFGEVQDLRDKGKSREKGQSINAILFEAKDKIEKIIAQEVEPIRITKRIEVKEKIITPKGEVVLDFGQNMAGFVEVKLPKLHDEKLMVYHAEALDKDNNFYTENLRTAKSIDTYIYENESVGEMVMPHFTYHGFRYILLEGVEKEVDISDFTACVLHTDMEKTGAFWCDNPLVTRLQQNIEWGQRSNFFDVPTDCPQRDERLGWTGDAQIFCETGGYIFNEALFFKKWLRDVAVDTTDEHGVPHVVPNILGNAVGTAIWSDCATIVPWVIYQIYGDEQVLSDQYSNMKQWIEYIRRHAGSETLWLNGFQRGDWLSLDGDASLNTNSGGTDKNLVANIYYAYSTRILRDTAAILEKAEDEQIYSLLYEKIKEALNKEYVTQNGRLVSETQTACVLLLHFNLLKEEYRRRVLQTLDENLLKHKNHLTTGFAGTAYICHVLSENDRHNLAEEVFLQSDYPGWFYAIEKGATTIWERWNSILPNGDFDDSGMNSLNHYTYGSIGSWLYQKVAGIYPVLPGYKKILIKPVLTKSITEVKAEFESMYGTIKSAWTCKGGKITIHISIPANTTATIILPEQSEVIEVGSGDYNYEYATDTVLEKGKYSMSSTFAQLVEEEASRPIFEKIMPGMLDSSMWGFVVGKTPMELLQMGNHFSKEMFEQLIHTLNTN